MELPGATGELLLMWCDIIALAKHPVMVDVALCYIFLVNFAFYQLEYVFSGQVSEVAFPVT